MKRQLSLLTDCRGSMAVSAIVLMFVFVGVLAFVIDLAHVKNVKTELSNAADTCALRGARGFFEDDLSAAVDMAPNAFGEDGRPGARDKAQEAIADNKSDNVNFALEDLDPNDIEVGIWDFKTQKLLPWVENWWEDTSYWGRTVGPAVRVPTKRDADVSLGSVVTVLARIFGIPTVDVHARATGAIGAVGGVEEGFEPEFPLALQDSWVKWYFDNNMEGQEVYAGLSPDGEDRAGWTDLDADSVSNAGPLLGDKNTPNEPVPEQPLDNEISLKNGVDCAAVKGMIEQYDQEWDRFFLKQAVDKYGNPIQGVYRPDPTHPNYKTPIFLFPVVATDKFVHSEVYGVVRAEITEVRDANGKDDPDTPEVDESEFNCRIKIKMTADPYFPPTGTYPGGKFYGVFDPNHPVLVE